MEAGRCWLCWSPASRCRPEANDKHLRVNCPRCGIYRLEEHANQLLGEWVSRMRNAGVYPPLPPDHRAMSALVRGDYERDGRREAFIEDFDALRARARTFGAGVWTGQVWSDNGEQSAVIRTFSILSLHPERSAGLQAEPGSEQYAYCQPHTAAVSGSDSGLDRFFAELDRFPPFDNRYSLVSYDPAWPAESSGSIPTPVGTFQKERDGRCSWIDVKGDTHGSAEYDTKTIAELSRYVHQLVYGAAGPRK